MDAPFRILSVVTPRAFRPNLLGQTLLRKNRNLSPTLPAEFTQAHLGIWVEEFCLLLIQSGGGEYLRAVTDTAFDAVERIRRLCTGIERADAD